MDPATVALGFLTGLLIGLTGMGGAPMGPALILGLGESPGTPHA